MISPYDPRKTFVNIRPTSDSGTGRTVVGLPRIMFSSYNHRPLGVVSNTQGNRCYLFSRNCELYAIMPGATVATRFATIAEPPLGVLDRGNGIFSVDTFRNSYKFLISGNTIEPKQPDRFRSTTVEVSSTNVLNEQFPTLALSQTYSPTNPSLSVADGIKVSNTLCDTYLRMRSSADLAGTFCHPMIIRCRYADKYGRTLFVGTPTVVAPENALNSSVGLTLSTDRTSIVGCHVSFPTFRIAVRAGESRADDALVAQLVVEATPQLCPIDFAAVATNALTRNADGSLTVTAGWPGVSANGDSVLSVAAAMSCLDELLTPIATISNPFAKVDESGLIHPEIVLTGIASLRPRQAVEKMRSKLAQNKASTATTSATGMLAAPNRFVAPLFCRNGSAVLAGNPSSLRFEGYSPLDFSSGAGTPTPWEAYAAVWYADGTTRIVATDSGLINAPEKVGAMLCCRGGDATELEIGVRTAGGCRRNRFKLTPSTDGHYSYWLSSDLQPTELPIVSSNSFSVAETEETPTMLNGIVASLVSNALGRFSIADTFDLGEPIAAIFPVANSSRGMEHRRNRFYIFSASGIRLLTVADDGHIANVTLIDSRGVDSAEKVCRVSDGKIAAATTSGHIVLLSGAVASTLNSLPASKLAFDSVNNELWIFPPVGSAQTTIAIRAMHSGKFWLRTLPEQIDNITVMNAGYGSIVALFENVFNLSEPEDISQPIDCRFQLLMPSTVRFHRPAMINSLAVCLRNGCGSGVRVTVAPANSVGTTATGEGRTVGFSGVLTRRIVVPGPFPRSSMMRLTVDGKFTPGTVVEGVVHNAAND